MTRSTSRYSAFPRCDLGEQQDSGVLKYVEFDSDFSLNILYVPGALQACAFSALLGTGLLAGWIRMFESSYCVHSKHHSSGALVLKIRLAFVLIFTIYWFDTHTPWDLVALGVCCTHFSYPTQYTGLTIH